MWGTVKAKRMAGRVVFLVVVCMLLAWGLLLGEHVSASRTVWFSLHAAAPLLVAGTMVSGFYWFCFNRSRIFGAVLAVFITIIASSFAGRPAAVGWLPERGVAKPSNPTGLVMPHDPLVVALADNLQTPLRMSNWVFAMVEEAPDESIGYADYWQSARETLGRMAGDCEDKAILLVSLLRAGNFSEGKVFVVMGKIHIGGERRGHAWVVLYDGDGKPWYLDPALGISMSDTYFDFTVAGQFNDRVVVAAA